MTAGIHQKLENKSHTSLSLKCITSICHIQLTQERFTKIMKFIELQLQNWFYYLSTSIDIFFFPFKLTFTYYKIVDLLNLLKEVLLRKNLLNQGLTVFTIWFKMISPYFVLKNRWCLWSRNQLFGQRTQWSITSRS